MIGLKSRIGLVVRRESVEVVEVLRRGRRLTVRRHAAVPVAGAGDADEQMAQTITSALRDSGLGRDALKKRRVRVSVPPQDVLLRFFSLPWLPRPEWKRAVQFEARKYIPFKTSDLVWDYEVRSRHREKTLDVIFAAIERTVFERVEKWLSAAGLQLDGIEPQSFGLARAIARTQGGKSSRAFTAAVDLEGDRAHIILVRDGSAYLTRDVSFAAVEGEPVEPGGPPGQAGQGAPDARAERLLSELRLSMEFFTREFAGATIDRVLLYGDAATTGAWARAFSSQLGCPVELGRLPATPGTETAAGVSASCASAIGVALGRRKRAGRSIDFRRQRLEEGAAARRPTGPVEIWKRTHKPALATCAGVIAALLAGLWVFGSREVSTVRRELAHVVEERPDVALDLHDRSTDELHALQEQLQGQLTFLHRFLDGRVRVSAKLDALARSLPGGIWLTDLDFQNPLGRDGFSQPGLTLVGACFLGASGQELSAIREFEERMRANSAFFEGFSSSKLKAIRENADLAGRYSFRTFEVDYRAGERL